MKKAFRVIGTPFLFVMAVMGRHLKHAVRASARKS
jgi:hypothetical protein